MAKQRAYVSRRSANLGFEANLTKRRLTLINFGLRGIEDDFGRKLANPDTSHLSALSLLAG